MSLPVFQHPCYAVVEDDQVVRIAYHKGASLPPPAEEDASLVEAVSAYTRALLISRFQLQQRWIPSENSPARCDILLSPNWDSCETLVLVLQNQFGAQPGVWSRSACVSQGLRKGSMLSLLQGCKAAGYGWIIANANCNSVVLEKGRGKEPIEGSASPEEHVLSVYESYVRQTAATHLLLLGYGHGAVLCKEILQRELALSSSSSSPGPRLAGIALLDASQMGAEDDSNDVTAFLQRRCVAWEASRWLPPACAIPRAKTRLGVAQVLSVGAPPVGEAQCRLWALHGALGSMLRFFHHAISTPAHEARPLCQREGLFPLHEETLSMCSKEGSFVTCRAESKDDSPPSPRTYSSPPRPPRPGQDVGYAFAVAEARLHSVPAPLPPCPLPPPSFSPVRRVASAAGELRGPIRPSSPPTGCQGVLGLFAGLFSSCQGEGRHELGKGKRRRRARGGLFGGCMVEEGEEGGTRVWSTEEERSTSVDDVGVQAAVGIQDFELLKVVGKGAFGKVMLARKVTGPRHGSLVAIKVLKKARLQSMAQVQHAVCERAILCALRHPFIVRLRFAFASPHSLYLVTDYYGAGSLFVHLRRCGSFSESRTRFYASELLLALGYLHEHHILYRDLKLENVLMDAEGHIALTDFGLSKQHVSSPHGARTFCGTAEYMAPELLKGHNYGPAVDWWSFGVLVYEMLCGSTPFYSRDRRHMFHCIVHSRPAFPPALFTKPAVRMLARLLDVCPDARLGGGSTRGARDVMEQDFFRGMDWGRLVKREVEPPFKPRLKSPLDTKFVPANYHKLEAKESVTDMEKSRLTMDLEHFNYNDEALWG